MKSNKKKKRKKWKRIKSADETSYGVAMAVGFALTLFAILFLPL